MDDKNRVVVTGIGVISPIGSGTSKFWDNICKGVNGVEKIKSFDTTDFRTQYGAEVKDYNPDDFYEGKLKIFGKASQYAISVSKMALEMAKIDLDNTDRSRFGVSFGTTMGEIQEEELMSSLLVNENYRAINPPHFAKYPCNKIPNNIGIFYKLEGPNIMIPTACAAGNFAIGYALDCLRLGEADYMLAGGSDPFSKVAFVGFNRLLACALEKCQPFSINRTGMIVGEGAGVLLLERLSTAKERNAGILAEVLGYGISCDAHHMTIPHPEGEGAVLATEKALNDAGINKDCITYISAHGTGTKNNDIAETNASKTVFGDRAYKIPMSSIKSMIGHTMGAASAIEAATCCLALKNNIIPPTINYEGKDPDCDLDYVTDGARETKLNTVISNAFGFGGNNSSLILRKFGDD